MLATTRKALRAEAERIHVKDKLEKIRFAEAQSKLLGHPVRPARPLSLTRCTAAVWHEVCRRSRLEREEADALPPRSRQTARYEARKAAKVASREAARRLIATRRQKRPALAA